MYRNIHICRLYFFVINLSVIHSLPSSIFSSLLSFKCSSGKNEFYSMCENNLCQSTCANPLTLLSCDAVCTPGCICLPGFFRNTKNLCVRPDQCDVKPKCVKKYEVFSFCGDNGCEPTCLKTELIGCIPKCTTPGCVCAPGFIRNSSNECVLPSQCEYKRCTGPNEIFSMCGDDRCQKTCSNLEVIECKSVCSEPGCICAPGFVRNSLRTCVPPSNCPRTVCTGANEVFSQCGNDGCQRTCTRLDVNNCVPICSAPACVCAVPFVRNQMGICVPEQSCQNLCAKANEVYSPFANNACERSCNKLDVDGCVNTCESSRCVCSPGYVRSIDGSCILPSQCPPVCTGPNEILSACGNDGCQRSCNRLDIFGCQSKCSGPGCICHAGYVRNNYQQCVLPSTCNSTCTGMNEVYSICGNDGCQRTCNRLNIANCISSCSSPSCVCALGYVKNDLNQCILPSMCPVKTCTKANEVYSACGDDGCQPTCNRLNVSLCTRSCGPPACICAVGYVRNSLSQCVPPSECVTQSCPGANQVYSICGNDGCQRSCDKLDIRDCVPKCNSPGCICIDGFVKNSIGECVPIFTCQTNICNRPNQIYSGCGDDGCQRSCDRLDITNCISRCSYPACICANGFVKNSYGDCVATSSCPTVICTRANEVYSGCGDDGCQRRCDRLDTSNCVPKCGSPECICANGFVKNSFGNCVAVSSCQSSVCIKPNQIYSGCGDDGCQRRCDRLDISNCTSKCGPPECICAHGFVKNLFGDCVAVSSCPTISCTKANQIYSGCGDNGCQQRCDRLNVINCTPICSLPSCICLPGFVKNYLGDCIPVSSCPSVTCPKRNEIYSGCGDDGCQRRCDRLDVINCNSICGIPACICLPGFVKNNLGDCVSLSSCPSNTCTKPNQIYSECGDDGCQPRCDRLNVINCTPRCGLPACICSYGFIKNDFGDCVSVSSCPINTCTKANEVYSGCGDDGCQRRCNRLNVTNCVPNCSTPSCICIDGFVKNTLWDCVPISTCPAMTCPRVNQVYSGCGDDGCQKRCDRLVVTSCAPVCGTPACICADGYVKNAFGDCVPVSSCPSMTCTRTNQIYSGCGDDGCQKTCDRLNVTSCVPNCNIPACICTSGFVKNSFGDCVPISSCPAMLCTRPNQVYSGCGDNGCQRRCDRLNVAGCVSICNPPSCICADGFVKNSFGECVAVSACPVMTCLKPNQIYSACGDDGCRRRCDRLDVSTCVSTCNAPACICVDGFVLNSLGDCVAISACPVITCLKPNQIYSGCGDDGCRRRCDRLDVSTCISSCNAPACICIDGFVLNSSADCVAVTACPSTSCTGPNQLYSGCGDNGCQRRCDRLDVSTCSPTCNVPACICSPGYVKNALGVCIAPTECPTPVCPTNEVYSVCGNDNCRPTCIKPDTTGCVPTCRTSACICATGFVRNDAGVCVMPSQCPTPTCTKANEVLSACGNDCCQRSCKKLDITLCVPVCSGQACVCATGFVRNDAGDCVLPSECPTTCIGANEVFSNCGNNVCQQTCTFNDPSCVGGCVPGCICQARFLRDSNGVCVISSSCASCVGNEQFRSCAVGQCENTCANPTLSTTSLCNTLGACISKCFCSPGFVRQPTGQCRPAVTCP